MNNTATQNSIHAADRLLCGCQIDAKSGDVFSACSHHTRPPAASFKDMPEHGLELMPIPKHEGMKALCVQCMSPNLVPHQDYIECKKCGHHFLASEIVNFGLSFPDSVCLACGNKHFGAGSVCESCLRQEGLLCRD